MAGFPRAGQGRLAARIGSMLALLLLLSLPAAATGGSPLAVTYEIEALTTNATRLPDGTWLVPVGERVEWHVIWTVKNTTAFPVQNVELRNNYSAEIVVDQRSVNGSRGEVDIRRLGGGYGATRVYWSIGTLQGGSSASLSFRIHTGTNPKGKQHYADPGDYCLDSALTIRWKHGSKSLQCIPVRVDDKKWMRIELPFTRKDWRVLKPGDYTSLALQVRLFSNSSVSVEFHGFHDLTLQDPPPDASLLSIPTWYATGRTLAEAFMSGWWQAAELNAQRFTFNESDSLEDGLDWYLWERLNVAPGHQAGDYRAGGTVRFILANTSAWVGDQEIP